MRIKSKASFKSGLVTGIMACAFFVSSAAVAQTCDPQVMDAMQAKAKARVAYDVATTEEIIKKPDSVLAMTCFNQAAGVSAADSGAIFSGDFTSELTPIIEPALSEMLQNFNGSIGVDMGVMNMGTLSNMTGSFNCPNMQDVWDTVTTIGINGQVPQITFDNLMTGTAPAGAGPVFNQNWTAELPTFTALNAQVTALPTPVIPNFSGANTLCDVLTLAGAATCP